MMYELVYTSAPQGLKPGTSGFCVVAMSRNMHPLLVQHLERMSGYRHLNAPGSSNPVGKSFACVSIQGKSYFILSRIADAGLDYSGRSNHIAHHIVIEATSEHSAGPAYYLGRDDLFYSHWSGQPRHLSPRELPESQVNPKPCIRWQSVTGDAGWATEPLEAVLKGKTCTLIVLPNVDSLSLIAESLALLPASERWKTTFSTYYTKPVAGTEFQWRCVIQNTPEALARETNVNSAIDLTSKLGPARGRLSNEARNGLAIHFGASKSEKRNLPKETLVAESNENSQTASGIARARSPARDHSEITSVETAEPPKYPQASSQFARESQTSSTRMRPKSSRWLVAAVFAMGIALGGIIVAITLIPRKQTLISQSSSKQLTIPPVAPPLSKTSQETQLEEAPEKENQITPKPDSSQPGNAEPIASPHNASLPPNTNGSDSNPSPDSQPTSATTNAVNELAAARQNLSDEITKLNKDKIALIWNLDKPGSLWEPKNISREILGELSIHILNPFSERCEYRSETFCNYEGPKYWEIWYLPKKVAGETADDKKLLGKFFFSNPEKIYWELENKDWENKTVRETVWEQAFLFCKMEFTLKADSPNASADKSHSDASFTVAFRKPQTISLAKLLSKDGFEWKDLPPDLWKQIHEQIRFRTPDEAILRLKLDVNAPTIGLPPVVPGEKQDDTKMKENAILELKQYISGKIFSEAIVEFELVMTPVDEKPIADSETTSTTEVVPDGFKPFRIWLKPTLKIWFHTLSPAKIESVLVIDEVLEFSEPIADNVPFGVKELKLKSKSNAKDLKEFWQVKEQAKASEIKFSTKNIIPQAIKALKEDFRTQIAAHLETCEFDFVIGENESTVSVIRVKHEPKAPADKAKTK